MAKRIIRMLAIGLVVCLLLTLGACGSSEVILRVCVLDVGQSDCILLSQGDTHMLIDTGTATARDALVGELAACGVRELAFVLITHPHEDHYGNARTVLEKYQTQLLLLPDVEAEEYGYRMVTDAAARCGVSTETVGDGYVFSLGSAACSVLTALPEDENLNNASLVLRIEFGDTVLLFMGDTEKEGEQALLERYGETVLDCDFLKVGHHGSKTASGSAFLQATTPMLAAISCGVDNEFGFPHDAVLAELETVGATVWRTDREGTLEFIFDGEKITVTE